MMSKAWKLLKCADIQTGNEDVVVMVVRSVRTWRQYIMHIICISLRMCV